MVLWSIFSSLPMNMPVLFNFFHDFINFSSDWSRESIVYLEMRWKLQKWETSLEYLRFHLSKSNKFVHFCNFYLISRYTTRTLELGTFLTSKFHQNLDQEMIFIVFKIGFIHSNSFSFAGKILIIGISSDCEQSYLHFLIQIF